MTTRVLTAASQFAAATPVDLRQTGSMTQLDYPDPDLTDQTVRLRRWTMADLR